MDICCIINRTNFILLYAKSTIDFTNDEVELTIPTFCTIEILLPSQSLNELNKKAKKYFEKGVHSCWIVIPVWKNVLIGMRFSNPTKHFTTNN